MLYVCGMFLTVCRMCFSVYMMLMVQYDSRNLAGSSHEQPKVHTCAVNNTENLLLHCVYTASGWWWACHYAKSIHAYITRKWNCYMSFLIVSKFFWRGKLIENKRIAFVFGIYGIYIILQKILILLILNMFSNYLLEIDILKTLCAELLTDTKALYLPT